MKLVVVVLTGLLTGLATRLVGVLSLEALKVEALSSDSRFLLVMDFLYGLATFLGVVSSKLATDLAKLLVLTRPGDLERAAFLAEVWT